MVVLLNVGSPSNPSLVQVAMSFVSLSTLECYLAARKDIKGQSLNPRLKSTPNPKWQNDFVSAARENFDLVCHQGLSVRHAQVEIYFGTQAIKGGPKKWLLEFLLIVCSSPLSCFLHLVSQQEQTTWAAFSWEILKVPFLGHPLHILPSDIPRNSEYTYLVFQGRG